MGDGEIVRGEVGQRGAGRVQGLPHRPGILGRSLDPASKSLSEYEYYEFQAIDRPLSPDEVRALRAISSRATITPTRFSNFYNYGSLKANPLDLLARYFDVFVYLANWRYREHAFRFPKALFDAKTAKLYTLPNGLTVRTQGACNLVIVSAESPDDETEFEDDEGRGGSLRWPAFGRTWPLDPDLVAAAAEGSQSLRETSDTDLQQWIASLSDAEKTQLLVCMARHDGAVAAELAARFRRATKTTQPPSRGRRVGELRASAERRADE